MYEWLRRALTVPEVKSLRRNFTKKTIPTYSDIMLSILSSHNNKTKQISYKECVPTSLGDIQFESTATGTEFITFGVTFRFSYFDLV